MARVRRRLPGWAAPVLGPRERRARSAERLVRRVPVPDEVVEWVEFGSDAPGSIQGAYWRLVEDRVAGWVSTQLPPGARDVWISLDPGTLEVVLQWRPGAARRRRL